MKIIKLKKLSSGKYEIVLDDNKITTFDNVILKYNLLYKKELSNEELKKIVNDSNYYEIYNKTLKYATKKIRSEMEINKYLDKFDIKDSDKNKIVIKLKKLNFINDRAYTKAFISDKIHLSKYGIDKIKKLLKQEGIDNTIIEEEISKIDTSEVKLNLENKIKKKIENNNKYSNYELKNKILDYFINQGYKREDILFYLEKYKKEDNDILKKEFNKLYCKYKNKYDENTFLLKLKQKLYQKGFSNEQINNLIQEKTEE